jgi:hypothetical protein
VEYRGWKNNLRLANDRFEAIVTLDVGPRVIAYREIGGFNVMKNYDEMMGKSGESEWQIRGGHRFWLAPEDLTRTYYADNNPVSYKATGPCAAQFTPPEEKLYGVQKVMEVRLAEKGSRIDVTLTVTNTGQVPTTLAPWGPTVMAPGGVEVIPIAPKYNHPGHPSRAKNPFDFAPNQSYVVWPYTDFTDSRWHFGKNYLFLRQDATKGPSKIGLAHPVPWVAYVNNGTMFVKRFIRQDWATYPDTGTSYQTFSNEDMLEMETVGILCTLIPGQSATLTESWELYTNIPHILTEADADQHVRKTIEG